MALKDWKKSYESKNEIVWIKDGGVPNGIELQLKFYEAYNDWRVFTYGSPKKFISIKFKTKSQAMVYARSYMRSH